MRRHYFSTNLKNPVTGILSIIFIINSKIILDDIFCRKLGMVLEEGLVNSTDSDDFDRNRTMLLISGNN